MAKVVRTIPARSTTFSAFNTITQAQRKVAAYARVSTDSDEQYTSFEAQSTYYHDYINRHEGWQFVKVYADEGISGLSTRQRVGFQEMIADALAGKIDLIITKSVSRFARNTVDTLQTIRELKAKNVEVFFEKENIYTFDGKGELLLTIMGSLAQEESRSISENVRWGKQRCAERGQVVFPYSNMLGFKKTDDGFDIDKDEAEIVKYIYRRFIEGASTSSIAKELMARDIPTATGCKTWRAAGIKSILQNEKYKGDAILQKTFIPDFLTKKAVVNEGQMPKYYVKESHTAIIEPATWDMVQIEIERRATLGKAYSSKGGLASKIICADCGAFYGRKVWHSTDKYRTIIWQCNDKLTLFRLSFFISDKNKNLDRSRGLSELKYYQLVKFTVIHCNFLSSSLISFKRA